MEENKLIIKDECKARFQPVVDAIHRLINAKQSSDSVLVVAIDGKCASGKTTLGYYLKEVFSCNLFHMDDFFLQIEQRTPERLAEIGGNVDYERFKTEVIDAVIAKETVVYRPFSCKTRTLQSPQRILPQRLNIIEGSYSQHPYFNEIYDLKVFVDLPYELQLERIHKRNGTEMLMRFVDEWIPKENAYFERFKIKENSNITI
jgi:uridine kinase